MDTVTITHERFRTLSESAARYLAVGAARRAARTGQFFHPGDAMGPLLCEAWRLDEGLPALIVASFVSTFDDELERMDVSLPIGRDKIVTSLQLSVNEAVYPDVDVPKMIARIRQDLPHYV